MAERQFRCAVYTRKSTEEGLEKEFNSLHAQREACEAYIASQRSEGWKLLPEAYDDGGISGGTMKRPALKRLLADVAAGKVDVIVVYKVDRLTRALADFAKIVEILDRNEASFVSVTQAFNTTTSMGRLTLNVLLSFAQFEREVTAERIRDKIAASKAKGMWMGGVPPLGYRVENRKLIVAPEEVPAVRELFERYLRLASVDTLCAHLEAEGFRTRERINQAGETIGGRTRMTRGMLYNLLKNPIYRGQIKHRDKVYPGQHEAIIEEELWDRAQALLGSQHVDRKLRTQGKTPSLLTGLAFDAYGRRLTPTMATKQAKRYRYYAAYAAALDENGQKLRPWRIPAHDLESLVFDVLRSLLNDSAGLSDTLPELSVDWTGPMLAGAKTLVAEIEVGAGPDLRRLLLGLVEKIVVGDSEVTVELRRPVLVQRIVPAFRGETTDDPIILRSAARLVRSGLRMRLVIDSPAAKPIYDESLVRLIATANAAWKMMVGAGRTPLTQVAEAMGYTKDYFTMLLRLSRLAPDIVTAILEARQPPSLTRNRLARAKSIPLDWPSQRQMFGFG